MPFHDTTGEAAFVVPYVAAMQSAQLEGAHWWCASDLYTEHGCPPPGKGFEWIPHENYSGGMPRSEFTGRWGFTTVSVSITCTCCKATSRLRLYPHSLVHLLVWKRMCMIFSLGACHARAFSPTLDLMQLTLCLHAQPSGIPKPIHRAFQLLHAAGDSQLEVVAAPGGTCDNATTVLAIANNSKSTAGEIRSTGLMIFLSNTGRGNCTVTLAGLPGTESALLHKIDSSNGNPLGLWQRTGANPFPTPAELESLQVESGLQPMKLRIDQSRPALLDLEPNALQVLVI